MKIKPENHKNVQKKLKKQNLRKGFFWKYTSWNKEQSIEGLLDVVTEISQEAHLSNKGHH